MYIKSNFLSKLLFIAIMGFFSFCLFFVVSPALNIDCDKDGSCKIYESNLFGSSSNFETLNLSNIDSLTCKAESVRRDKEYKYNLRYTGKNGSGRVYSIRDYSKFGCEIIAEKLEDTLKQTDKTLHYKRYKADSFSRLIAKGFALFLIIMTVITTLFGKVELHIEKER